jgi:ribosomal protein S18 acetylase RimI-like enzyme
MISGSDPILRSPRPDEVGALHELLVAVQRADGLPIVAHLDEVADWFESPGIAPLDDLCVIEIDDALVAYGTVDHSPSGKRLERAMVFGGVHPQWRGRGLGRSIIDWQRRRAAERLGATDPSLPAYAVTYIYDFEVEALELLEAAGFQRDRVEHELICPLGSLAALPISAGPAIEGIEIRPWSSADSEPVRLVSNAAFADHWGSPPRSVDAWEHGLESNGCRLDLSLVATDTATGEVVGFSLNGHYPDDQDVTGRLDGWIQNLGTARSHRKRGIASALVRHSLQTFVNAGFDHAMLSVDTENPSGAYDLYIGLGFERLHATVTMRHLVRSGTEPSD